MKAPIHARTVADLIAALQTFPTDMQVMGDEGPGEVRVVRMQYGPWSDASAPHAVRDDRGHLWLNTVHVGAPEPWEDEDDDLDDDTDEDNLDEDEDEGALLSPRPDWTCPAPPDASGEWEMYAYIIGGSDGVDLYWRRKSADDGDGPEPDAHIPWPFDNDATACRSDLEALGFRVES